MELIVDFNWDNGAHVWVATSKDIPGLVLESGSYDALVERVNFAIPELLELNNKPAASYNLIYRSERREKVLAHG
ncbi:MAG: DUF1902 domain-containing protein [Dehalococcoidales bacterium]|nr:DUF1902 domain-containing protein [Dehalococcoidales bacterium]